MSFFEMSQLGALGNSPCGPDPTPNPGETAVCCPNVGWVLFGSGEPQYGICERAEAQATGQSSGGTSIPADASPMERVEAMRAALEERRNARDEEEHQRMLAEVQLRFVMGRMQAVQRSEQARVAAEAAAQAAAAKRRRDAEEKRLRDERNKKLLMAGAVGLVAAKFVGFF